MKKLSLTLLVAALLAQIGACKVQFDDSQTPFRCDGDTDCGGGGYFCVDGTYCCRKDGEEVEHGCDHRDNDCDGETDEGAGTLEVCNGVDDDCDGTIDDGFDLIQDPRNCGACDRACQSDQACMNGVCVQRGELSCSDGVDNDGDLLVDCADPECNLELCGVGCQCRALLKAEGNCNDGNDNDGDAAADCADADCAGAGCGSDGCVCADMKKREIACRDDADNDGDGMKDCADPDCAAALCQADPSTFRCGGAGTCSCNDGGTVAETGARCRDRIDNDCNGKIDCAEAGCEGVSCALDGGSGCLCSSGGAKETLCADRRDNDNDGTTDCMDVLPDGGGDCPLTTPCTFLSGGVVTNGICAADHTCK
ncbi:MAG: hypothetical protein IPJ65_09660 [Archangiaceae bacterium]|nr:hypothetical protein [Archangiaceae bacterium]